MFQRTLSPWGIGQVSGSSLNGMVPAVHNLHRVLTALIIKSIEATVQLKRFSIKFPELGGRTGSSRIMHYA